MQLRHILAAADDSAEGRAAIQAALALARMGSSRVTVLRVCGLPEDPELVQRTRDGLRTTLQGMRAGASLLRVEVAVVSGLPGIEIGRFAERSRADLIVVGRKQRSEADRLRLGDTADAVARRSPVPCLLVPSGDQGFGSVLAALDGTERGMYVLRAATDFTRATGARLGLVSVEPGPAGGEYVPGPPTARTARLQNMVRESRSGVDLGSGRLETPAGGEATGPVMVRQGAVVPEVLREVASRGADVLVIGYRRGGPAGPAETGDICRRLAHESPSAVLTVPL